MALHSPKKYPVKIVPINIDAPHVVVDIESQRSNKRLLLKSKRKKCWNKCWKLSYAALIISIVQYGIGIVLLMLFVPKPNRIYNISELTWIPYLLGCLTIHIPTALCVCKLEPTVNNCCDYGRFFIEMFTK